MRGSAPFLVASLLISSANEKDGESRSDGLLADVGSVPTTTGNAIAFEFRGKYYHDLWIAATNEEDVEVLGYRMRGELLWLRSFNNGVKQLFGLNASYFDFDGLHPRARIDTFHSSIQLTWNESGGPIEQARKPEEPSCVESVGL
jgi:hypothetical protein